MSRPRIGITTSFGDGNQSLSHFYIDAIVHAGGLPIIVPVLQDVNLMQEFATILDGLLIPGGPGIVRGLVGELPDDLEPVDPLRDQADTLIFNAMKGRPVLGICYGMQFINAQSGGQIYGDLMAQIEGTEAHSPSRGGTEHIIQVDDHSRLHSLLGQELKVNTYHKQALATVGEGLQAVAYSPDGVIEAIESTDGHMIGVQFHPERDIEATLPLFQDFVKRCER